MPRSPQPRFRFRFFGSACLSRHWHFLVQWRPVRGFYCRALERCCCWSTLPKGKARLLVQLVHNTYLKVNRSFLFKHFIKHILNILRKISMYCELIVQEGGLFLLEELINSNTSPVPYSKILELDSIVWESVNAWRDIFLYNGGQFQNFTVGRWRGVAVD